MGIFKKKSNEPADFNFSSMFVPVFPEVLPEWFEANKRSMEKLLTFSNSARVIPNSFLNIETAVIGISNHISEICENCEVLEKYSCAKCGKIAPKFYCALAASRDAEYLAYEIYKDQNAESADGIFIHFDFSAIIDHSNKDKIKFKMQQLAPIRLGNLVVKNVTNGFGMIHLADASATQDSNYFITGIPVEAGVYSVIAWMGYNEMAQISPMAIGVYSDAIFSSELIVDLELTYEPPEEIKKAIHESTSMFARVGDTLDESAADNFRICSDFYPQSYLATSWLHQRTIESENSQELLDLLRAEMVSNPSDVLNAIDALRIRGKKKIVFELLAELENKASELFSEQDLYIIAQMKVLPIGQEIN